MQKAQQFKLLFTMEEAAKALGLGRTTLYGLVRQGVITSVKVGRMRRIPLHSLERYVDSLEQEAING